MMKIVFFSAYTCLRASALARDSASKLACIDSIARAWLRRVVSNSSSFSWIRRSISWRIVANSIWARRTLASSCSSADSASSNASWISSFSNSARLRALSNSCNLSKLNSYYYYSHFTNYDLFYSLECNQTYDWFCFQR